MSIVERWFDRYPESDWDLRRVVSESRPVLPLCRVPGIYFLLLSERLVYVGQSNHVSARVARHLIHRQFDACAILPCHQGRFMRESVERYFIGKLRPAENISPGPATASASRQSARHGPARLYARDQGGERRWYADFRDLGGGRVALKPPGEERATTDLAIAESLLAEKLKELRRV